MGDERTALEFVLASDEEKVYLESEEKRLYAKLESEERTDDGEYSDEEDDTAISNKLNIVTERLEDIGARAAAGRATAILTGLQFTPEMQNTPTKQLSGGWRMRVKLASALFITPDILL